MDLRIGEEDCLRFKNGCILIRTLNQTHNSSNGDSFDFNIFFANPANFSELSADWDIVSHSAGKIELVRVDNGNGGSDLLTFEKN